MKVTDSTQDTLGFSDGNTAGTDYAYDANGNMIQDLNKGITNIQYNHLNLPIKVEFETLGDSITYLYDAAGIKLQQKVYHADTLFKTTDYIGEFIYETMGSGQRELQLIQHEEGRIIPISPSGGGQTGLGQGEVYDYQYHLKDHLGNVRLTFSTEHEYYDPSVSYEDADLIEDSEYFGNVDVNRVSHPAASNVGKATRLNSATPAGTFAVINVNKGDTVHLSVKGYFEGGTGYSNPISDISVLENAWNNALTNSPAIESAGINPSQVNGLVALISLLSAGGSSDNTVPGAYLNYIYFDEEMNVIETKEGLPRAGFAQITTDANFNEELIDIDTIIAEREGRIIAYLSYESNSTNYVYFDDFTVYHGKTNVVSSQDYYPFGLTFNESVRVASSPQNYKFGGKEELVEWGVMDYDARQYDPAIGRFIQIDPMAEVLPNWTPYRYGFNNPLRFTDPTGMLETDGKGNFKYTDKDEIAAVLAGLQKQYGGSDSNNNGDSEESGDQQSQDKKEIAVSYKVKGNLKGALDNVNSMLYQNIDEQMGGGDPTYKKNAIWDIIHSHVQWTSERRNGSFIDELYIDLYLPEGITRNDFLDLLEAASGKGVEEIIEGGAEKMISKRVMSQAAKNMVKNVFKSANVVDKVISPMKAGHDQRDYNQFAKQAYFRVLVQMGVESKRK